MKTPKPKAKPDTLYWDDNGRVVCGACAGNTLRYTLRTLSGHRAKPVTAAESEEFRGKVHESAKVEQQERAS